jgi:hypothetical protein
MALVLQQMDQTAMAAEAVGQVAHARLLAVVVVEMVLLEAMERLMRQVVVEMLEAAERLLEMPHLQAWFLVVAEVRL